MFFFSRLSGLSPSSAACSAVPKQPQMNAGFSSFGASVYLRLTARASRAQQSRHTQKASQFAHGYSTSSMHAVTVKRFQRQRAKRENEPSRTLQQKPRANKIDQEEHCVTPMRATTPERRMKEHCGMIDSCANEQD